MVNVEGDSVGAGIVQHLSKIGLEEDEDMGGEETRHTPPPEYNSIGRSHKKGIENSAFDSEESAFTYL